MRGGGAIRIETINGKNNNNPLLINEAVTDRALDRTGMRKKRERERESLKKMTVGCDALSR